MAIFDGEISKLESALDRSSKVQDVISHNIANANTPGFVAMKFDDVLGKAVERMDNPKVNLEQELAALSENGLAYSSYTKMLITKLNTLRTVVKMGKS